MKNKTPAKQPKPRAAAPAVTYTIVPKDLAAHLFQQFGKNAIGCANIQIPGRFIRQ